MVRKIIATIGIFDGVHQGHQKILEKLVKEAKKHRAKSLVITFHPHPRNAPQIISLDHRLRLIKELGVDFSVVVRFTKTISQMEPEEFIKKVLLCRFNIKSLVVGKNFLFGYKQKGNFALLKKLGRKYGFCMFGIEPVKFRRKDISSTRIRCAIEMGHLKEAGLMLDRPVTVLGTVVKGRNIGRKIGFPTANINPHHETIPPSGVYAVDVKIHELPRIKSRIATNKGILNIGTRPTFGIDGEPTIELHIFNFKKDIYGKDVEIIFKKKIRDEKRFSSIAALRKQIQRDIVKQSGSFSPTVHPERVRRRRTSEGSLISKGKFVSELKFSPERTNFPLES